MSTGRLTPLQERVLVVLAEMHPPGTLEGGGALGGFHLAHRTTRDLDLVWPMRVELGHLPSDADALLRRDGFDVDHVVKALSFHRLAVRDASDQTVVDFVADPMPAIEEPERRRIGDTEVNVATPHGVLVGKLGALLGRTEPRDLVDVKALLDAGQDLEAALADAPRRDAGFSPLTLAWLLRSFPHGALATQGEDLVRFRDELVLRLVDLASADGGSDRAAAGGERQGEEEGE